jgi:8-hydroxy-5-deazaflavin:NADPH oxidoreductase
MHIGIIGSGIVAQTLGGKLAEAGHRVTLGSRDTSRRHELSWGSVPSPDEWVETQRKLGNRAVEAASFAGAALRGDDLVINATSGIHSLEALELASRDGLSGKILVDVSNPLDFSQGAPPRLAFCNESVAEQIQNAFPETRVVKTLNTVTAPLMIDPGALGAETDVFVAGNDAEAKAWVERHLLREALGWSSVVDLGDITAARGVEMYLPLWLELFGATGTTMLNIKVVKAA